MPIFALANAGVPIDFESIGEPVGLAVAAGLFFGKSIGIFGASWLTVKLGWATRPAGVTWPILGGAAFLGGIGFTMAMFIASLGLSGDLLVAAKIGVLLGSFASALAGMAILTAVAKKP
jgi:NhaA family Na+:H+ antiporter